jgi:hypothetical protein
MILRRSALVLLFVLALLAIGGCDALIRDTSPFVTTATAVPKPCSSSSRRRAA